MVYVRMYAYGCMCLTERETKLYVFLFKVFRTVSVLKGKVWGR